MNNHINNRDLFNNNRYDLIDVKLKRQEYEKSNIKTPNLELKNTTTKGEEDKIKRMESIDETNTNIKKFFAIITLKHIFKIF